MIDAETWILVSANRFLTHLLLDKMVGTILYTYMLSRYYAFKILPMLTLIRGCTTVMLLPCLLVFS